MKLHHLTTSFPSLSYTVYYFYSEMRRFTPVLSIRIFLDSFYLLIFCLMSTWIWRLPSVVNVALNLFNEVENKATPQITRKREVKLQSKTNFRFYLLFLVFFKNKTVENEIVNYPKRTLNCIEKRLTENSFSLFTSPLCTALENWNLFTLFTS